MRKIKAHTQTIGLLALALLAGASSRALAQSGTWFQSEVNSTGGANEDGTSIAQTRDGGYVTVSNYRIGGLSSIVLRRFNSQGASVVANRYSFASASCTAQSVRETSNGGVIIGGESTASGASGVMLIYIDPLQSCPGSGSSWARVYTGMPNSGLGGTVVRERSNGGFVAIGRSAVGGETRAQLIVTTAAGVRVASPQSSWNYRVPTGTLQLTFRDVREASNGDFLVVGDFWPNDTFGRVLAARLSSTGAKIWAKLYGRGATNTSTDNFVGESIEIKDADAPATRGMAIAGTVFPSSGGGQQAFVMRLDDNGTPMWQQRFPGVYGAKSIREAFIPGDRYLIMATRSFSEGGLSQIFGMGAAGGPGIFGGYDKSAGLAEWFEEAILTNDGGLARFGAVGGAASPRTFLAKTGTLPPFFSGTEPCLYDGNLVSPVDLVGVQDTDFQLAAETSVATPPLVCSTFTHAITERCQQRTGCQPAFSGQVLWIPFNEVGSTGTNVVSPANSATYFGSPLLPANSTGGCLGNELCLNGTYQFARVPNHPAINFGTGDFTISFRMKHTNAANTHPLMSILDKRDTNAGYHVFLNSNNTIGLNMTTAPGGSGFNNYTHPSAVVPGDGQCYCVSVSVSRTGPLATRVVNIWVNGTRFVASTPATVRVPSINSLAPLTIGNRGTVHSPAFYKGCIDELQLLNYFTDGDQNACWTQGTCAYSVHAQNTSMCTNGSQVTVTGYVCNQDSVTRSFNVGVVSEPVSRGCEVGGPSLLSQIPSSPISVPAGGCMPVSLTFAKPPKLLPGKRGCYSLVAQEQASGQVVTSTGSILGYASIACIPDGPVWPPFPPNHSTLLPEVQTFSVVNSTGTARTIPYQILVETDVTDPLGSPVSLDDQAPGVPASGSVLVPANSSVTRTVKVRFVRDQPTGFYSLGLAMDTDDDGTPETHYSSLFNNTFGAYCPGDFDGDGFVTGEDFDFFTQLFEAGDIGADFDRDGFVAGEDFDAYVQAFESGC